MYVRHRERERDEKEREIREEDRLLIFNYQLFKYGLIYKNP